MVKLFEDYLATHAYYKIHDEILYDILNKLVNREKKKMRLDKIKPSIYKKALYEFIKFGEFLKFPVKYIYMWKKLLLNNIALLDVSTKLYGHSSVFPYDEFNDMFFGDDQSKYITDFEVIFNMLDDYGLNDILPTFSNKQLLLSDYGLQPLLKLAYELIKEKKPEKILVIINKILDVIHQRSDLAELFIKGGSDSLYKISN